MPTLPPALMGRAERRSRQKRADKLLARMDALRAATRNSGAGYPVDQHLRECLDTYNDRAVNAAAGGSMPFTFGSMHGFVDEIEDEGITYFGLRPERDHAFLLGDFLDFATAPDTAGKRLDAAAALPEGVIHSYSPIDDVRSLAFIDAKGERVVFGGITMVRRGQVLHWALLGGPVTDLAARTAELQANLASVVERTKVGEGLTEPDWSRTEAAALPGTDDVWKRVAYGMFNLSTRSHDSRNVLVDSGVSYEITTDDPVAIGRDSFERLAGEDRAWLERMANDLQANALYFDIAEAAFSLPGYFAYRIDLVATEQRRTAIGLGTEPGRDRGRLLAASPDLRPSFRTVRTLRIASLAPEPGSTRSYTPPAFSVELEGFWRRLSPGSIGKDAAGMPVEGRTWVKGHMRWRDRPARGRRILVKSPVGPARERADDLVLARAAVPVPADADDGQANLHHPRQTGLTGRHPPT
jgi:hypothetical protein